MSWHPKFVVRWILGHACTWPRTFSDSFALLGLDIISVLPKACTEIRAWNLSGARNLSGGFHVSASRLMLPPRSVICGQIPSSIWARRLWIERVVGRVVFSEGLLHCCRCIRRSPFFAGWERVWRTWSTANRGVCEMVPSLRSWKTSGARTCKSTSLHGHFKTWK